MAASLGLKAIAFADHDSVASLAQGEILGSVTGVELIPSLELSTRFERFDLHLLCYLIEWRSKRSMRSWLQRGLDPARIEVPFDLGVGSGWRQGEGPTTAAVLNSLIAHPENRAGAPTPALHWGGKGRDLPFSTFCWDYFLEGGSQPMSP